MNHRSVPKVEDAPPIKAAKQWTGRLVADFYHHDEITEAFKANPEPGIGKWQHLLSEKWNSLPDEQKARYGVIAEQWKEQGPPPEVRRRSVPYTSIVKFTD